MTIEMICQICGAVLYTDEKSKQECIKRHKCKVKNEPLNPRLASADQGGIFHASEGSH
jgi:hypothetical protein